MAKKRPRGNRKPEAEERRIERGVERRGSDTGVDAGSSAPLLVPRVKVEKRKELEKAAQENVGGPSVKVKKELDERAEKARRFWERPWTKEAVELDAALP